MFVEGGERLRKDYLCRIQEGGYLIPAINREDHKTRTQKGCLTLHFGVRGFSLAVPAAFPGFLLHSREGDRNQNKQSAPKGPAPPSRKLLFLILCSFSNI